MNKKAVINQLTEKYPGKTIICIPEENPSEILCEIDPTPDHPDFSVAIAIIDKSAPHVHHKTTETYKVLKGSLRLYKNEKEYLLNEGDTNTILPGEIHYAVGDATWIEAISHPGWKNDDHILVTNAQ